MLRDELTKAGYLFLIASVPRKKDGGFDFSMLKTVLRQRVDLVVLLHDKKAIAQWLSSQCVPFIRLTADGYRPEYCAGLIRFNAAAAFSGFAEHCRLSGSKTVLLASVWDEMVPRDVFGVEGADVKRLEIAKKDLFTADGASIAELAVELFDRRLRDYGRGWLPDVLYLADDYFAMGALTALLSHGIRVPEDVRAVVWANKGGGCGPVFTKRFTRIEVDIRSCGTKVVESVLQYLRTGAFPDIVDASPIYISGDTFT
jgi:DNA-binding LacI/PurR family transcriptional regulator